MPAFAFQLADIGGAGAVWVKTIEDKAGRIKVNATQSWLGAMSGEIYLSPVGS